jgi:hypothetical protein
MEQIPSWETSRFSASQEIPRILWNANVHYRVYKSPSPVRFLNHINAVHAHPHPTSRRRILILSTCLTSGPFFIFNVY